MVKKIFYPLFAATVLLFAESALAEQIDAQQARQQAMAFLNRNATTKKMLKGGNADLQLAYTAQSGEYYAFNASAADGYVLVSGDDRMPAVIGYSDEGKFDADAIPDNMREWLDHNSYPSPHRSRSSTSPPHCFVRWFRCQCSWGAYLPSRSDFC